MLRLYLSKQLLTPGERLRNNSLRIIALLCGMIAFFAAGMSVHAGDSIESAGDVLFFLLPATAAGLTLGLRDGRGAVQFGESAALTLGVTYGLKYAVDEKRPNGGSQSFPSTHASISFSSAEFIRKRYGWEYGVPAYLAATFVAYSRVESRDHYAHDVIAGAVIGIVSSYVFTTPFLGLQIQPDTDGRYWGIRLSRNW
ncbi:MAG: phosphatase PAP2 family protein [Deltaproteobacteria bacterium]|nr:phosphatase PAP2 family protein [Deltaproteobacteria bacterium]MDO9210692.1 phosphatase PAP2 family protein [Deltaproteobacteria bacterium]